MTITVFDRATCKLIGAEVEAAVAAVAAKHGLTAQSAGGTFDATSFTAKIKLVVTDNDALERKERADFAQYCGWFDLKPDDYGKEFTHQGKRYRLTGVLPTRSKSPIAVTRLDDNSPRIFPAAIVPVIRKQIEA